MTGLKDSPFYFKINLFVITKNIPLNLFYEAKFDHSPGKKFICNLNML